MTKIAWTTEQIELLKQMAYDGASNAEIAKAVGKTVESVHHKRSHLGLTIAAVAAAKAEKAKKIPAKKLTPKKVESAKKAPAKNVQAKKAVVEKPVVPGDEKVYSFTRAFAGTRADIAKNLRMCAANKCNKCELRDMAHCRNILDTLAADALTDTIQGNV